MTNDNDKENPEQTNQTIFFTKFVTLAIFVTAFAWVANQGAIRAPRFEPPCFKDNVSADQEPAIFNFCTDTGGVECPDRGTCKGGRLVECIDKHYEISENKDNCVLTSPHRKEKVVAIQAVLEEMTLCEISENKDNCVFTSPHRKEKVVDIQAVLEEMTLKCSRLSVDEYPMFDYDDVQLANFWIIAIDALELSILMNEFSVKRVNDTLFIGFKSDYKLNTPMHCKVADAFTTIVYHFGNIIIAAIRSLLNISAIWFLLNVLLCVVSKLLMVYPMQAGATLVVIGTILFLRTKRK